MIHKGANRYKVVVGNGEFSLPPEYQRVEYIEGTGTQWIDTGLILKESTVFDVRFYEVNIPENPVPTNRTHIMGLHDSPIRYRIRRIESDNFYFLYGNSTSFYWSLGLGGMKNKLLDFHYSINKFTLSVVGGNTYEKIPESSYTFAQSNKTISLFWNENIGDQYFEGRFYFFTAKENDTPVRNMIPCYRHSDGVAGMYDTVNDVFYTNQGTGSFVVGNNVYGGTFTVPKTV
jgi:hypothetical protein